MARAAVAFAHRINVHLLLLTAMNHMIDDGMWGRAAVSKPFIFHSCKPMLEPKHFSSLILQALKGLFGIKEATAGL